MSTKVWSIALMMCAWVAGSHQGAVAQPEIGSAESVEHIVEGDHGGTLRRLSVSVGVFQDETISTGPASATRIRFVDDTILAMGATSRIALDRFVYDPNARTGDIAFNAVRGAFRFVTGLAQSSSYSVETPVASIGVRGTDFDVYVNRIGDTLALGRSGRVIACPRGRLTADPPDERCCDIAVEDAPLYGIILRGETRCRGPRTWLGRNPFRLIAGARSRDSDNDGNVNQPSPSPSPSDGGDEELN